MTTQALEDDESGSTDHGFVPRQLADIQKAMNDALAEIVDPRSGEKPFQNASDDTILQQTVAEFAETSAATENAAAIAFAMRDPLTAVGAGLSALVQLNAIMRKAGAATVIPIVVEADPSTLIPRGSLIGDANANQTYSLNEDLVVPQSGVVHSAATCTEFGVFDPEPDTIAVIQTPVPGWKSVTNRRADADGEPVGVLSVGTKEETDLELRRRQQQSTNATSFRQIEAIRAAVLNVPGVTFCRAYQNSTLETDARGIPGKSIALVVAGGDSRAVAETIRFRDPLGVGYWGNVAEVFYDKQGMAETVMFSRPVEREVGVRLTLEIVVDEHIQVYPSNGPDLIKAAILDFAANGHALCEPLGNTGFPPGQDIIRSYLYTPVNSVGGAKVVALELAVDGGAFAERDVAIPWNEIGVFAADRIEVRFT